LNPVRTFNQLGWSFLGKYYFVVTHGENCLSKNGGKGMKIIILASGDLWAGAEVMVYQLVWGLVNPPEIKLCVVLLNNGRLAKELKKLGVEVHVVDESKHSFPAIVRAVHSLVAAFSPDVIHSHRYKENLLAWLVTRFSRKVRLVSTQHGMPEFAGKKNGIPSKLRSWLSFWLLSCFFDRTVVVSEEMQQSLVGTYGFTDKGIDVIYNGISLPEVLTRYANKRVAIGSAGRLFPVKDYSLMVEIAKLVVAQSDMVDFVLAGDGPERHMLEEKVTEAGLHGRFKFLGHQDDMDIFYKSLDVYINTSVHEGIPMSVLEAMSYGLPVVVPKVGGFPEIVEEGISGYLIDARDPSVFSDRCVGLLSDPEKREQMAKAARQRVIDHFSREAMSTQYYQLYRKLLS
jgi:glycosyltransferase involved in cell wall biosynthesis